MVFLFCDALANSSRHVLLQVDERMKIPPLTRRLENLVFATVGEMCPAQLSHRVGAHPSENVWRASPTPRNPPFVPQQAETTPPDERAQSSTHSMSKSEDR
jgi:hypothetical protein